MPTILYAIGSLELGGAESQLTKLILHCRKQKLKIALFVLEADGYFQPLLEQQGIPIYNGGFSTKHTYFKRKLLLLRAWFRLFKTIILIRPDILHAYLPLTNFLGATAGRMLGVKQVITSRRALGTHQERHKGWKWIDRLTNRLSHYVTVNSQAVWEDTLKRDAIDPKKLVLIKNGLDLSSFCNLHLIRKKMRQSLVMSEDTLALMMVGNLIPYKGHAVLLEALAMILPTQKHIQFYFVGENRGIQKHLQQLAQELMIAEQIFFLGRRTDIPALLSAMDIYVHASFEEGSSNALLEAMAAELPIIATNVGGNKETLENGKHGILIPPSNPEQLKIALLDLIADKKLQTRLSRSAKNYVNQTYSIEQMVNSHIQLYTSHLIPKSPVSKI